MRVRKISVKLLCCLAMIAVVSGCSTWPYSGHSIRGRVVDSATGEPLKDVMVVVYWRTVTNRPRIGIYMDGGGPQPSCDELANLLSTSSGVDGTFLIPAWSASACFTMYGDQPELIVYKPGYKVMRLVNEDEDRDPTENLDIRFNNWVPVFILSTSRWDGATIKLAHDDDQLKNLRIYIDALMAAVGQVHPRRCFWNEARPAFVLAIQEERRLGTPFGREGGPGLHSVEDMLRASYAPNFYQIGDWTCGPMENYVQGLVKEADQIPSIPVGTPSH